MNKTEHLGLNQWALEDPIKMEDFNRDNAILDAALAGAASALGGKLGRSEIIRIKPSGGPTSSQGVVTPIGDEWNEWEYVCFLYHFPKHTTGNTDKVYSLLHDRSHYVQLGPFPLSGYLLVLLPRHDPDAKVAGFYIADRFLPFSLDFTFRELTQASVFFADDGTVTAPDVACFGGR